MVENKRGHAYFEKWACAKAGIQMVCINPLYTAKELEYAINKVDVKILICPKSVAALDYEKIIGKLRKSFHGLLSMRGL